MVEFNLYTQMLIYNIYKPVEYHPINPITMGIIADTQDWKRRSNHLKEQIDKPTRYFVNQPGVW